MNKNTAAPNLVLYLYEDSNTPQYRYRIQNPLSACESGSQKWRALAFGRNELDELRAQLSSARLLIVERQTAKNNVIPNLIKEAQRLGIKVVFDLDDLIFDYHDIGLIKSSTREKSILYWAGYIWGIRRIAKRADGFLTTNDFLAQKIKRTFKKPVAIIPNSLNAEQISASEKYLKSQKPHDGFTLGYFSGSPTHTKDFQLIEPEIIQFLENHDDAKLKIVGYMEFSPRAKALLDSGRIEFEPPVDYLKLQEKIADVDVNLAPLVENDFTNCKSELKFFEAAVVETTTIASPTFAFKNAIEDGKTGFLAQPGEWLAKLEYLYSHPAKNHQIALAAKAYCLKTYHGKTFLAQVEKAYDALVK
ncbi:glycosyltransferase [Candidatus Saccharibacteria bacterium]|nr:glycosyltransferase [Candidatus Saccharibacteria bacterium]MBR6122952.1 glycosyltransferase [Candidatus Saccharibacteria bacterium]